MQRLGVPNATPLGARLADNLGCERGTLCHMPGRAERCRTTRQATWWVGQEASNRLQHPRRRLVCRRQAFRQAAAEGTANLVVNGRCPCSVWRAFGIDPKLEVALRPNGPDPSERRGRCGCARYARNAAARPYPNNEFARGSLEPLLLRVRIRRKPRTCKSALTKAPHMRTSAPLGGVGPQRNNTHGLFSNKLRPANTVSWERRNTTPKHPSERDRFPLGVWKS